VLEGTSGTSCILDDMIITGKDDAEHLANLKFCDGFSFMG